MAEGHPASNGVRTRQKTDLALWFLDGFGGQPPPSNKKYFVGKLLYL